MGLQRSRESGWAQGLVHGPIGVQAVWCQPLGLRAASLPGPGPAKLGEGWT